MCESRPNGMQENPPLIAARVAKRSADFEAAPSSGHRQMQVEVAPLRRQDQRHLVREGAVARNPMGPLPSARAPTCQESGKEAG